MTDKDCKELVAVKSIFPNATSLLCQFHVLTAVSARLGKAKLQIDFEEEIFANFKTALYASHEQKLANQQNYLCAIRKYF